MLTGKESTKGEFIDEDGNPVFDKKTSKMVRNDDYHEIFHCLIEQINEHRQKGVKVYFVSDGKRKEIVPTAHYTSGGIKTDSLGRVDGCKNLFAIGECQANGSMNNGRLPGFPFTSAIVYGRVLGNYFRETLT